MCARLFLLLICATTRTLGQTSMRGQPMSPQRLYGVFPNGGIVDILNDDEALQPIQNTTVPFSCNSYLQCNSIPPQQNGSYSLYIASPDNSSLILIQREGRTVQTYNITAPCVISDFMFLSNVIGSNHFPLLIACALTDEGNIRYVLANQYGNVTRINGIEQVPIITGAIINPIILELPSVDGGDINFAVVSLNNQNAVVTYGIIDLELKPIASGLPCEPVSLKRIKSKFIFLVICIHDRYLVNISAQPITFHNLSSSVIALSSSVKYTLAISSRSSSTTTLIIQEHLYPEVNTTIQLNTVMIYDADFGPDDRFAYVATDLGVVFINVIKALSGAEQFTHNITSQLCRQCPSVVFLDDNTAMVSSVGINQSTSLKLYHLWPPQEFHSRMLNEQPRLYWFTPFLFPNAHDASELSAGAIAGIVSAVGVTIILLSIIIITMVGIWQCRKNRQVINPVHVKSPTDPPGAEHVLVAENSVRSPTHFTTIEKEKHLEHNTEEKMCFKSTPV